MDDTLTDRVVGVIRVSPGAGPTALLFQPEVESAFANVLAKRHRLAGTSSIDTERPTVPQPPVTKRAVVLPQLPQGRWEASTPKDTAVHGARFIGITYDPRDDALELALDSGTHRIEAPEEVWTVEEPDGLISALEAVCADGSRQVVSIKRVGLRRGE